MPRLARLDAPGVLHHIMGRGIGKSKIFLDEQDRINFLSRLADIVKEGMLQVYAWTVLPNHFHLLCKTQKQPLATSMRKLLTGYAIHFNRRHHRHGHLFQNRYKSIVCQEESYLLELVRYIHLNLLRAGLVKNIQELNHSPWSGHSAILGNVQRIWQDTKYILSYLGKGGIARRRYQEFVEDGISLGRRPELVGGGLIRSLGGWSSVLALRRRGDKQVSDERILGDEDFVLGVLNEAGDSARANLRIRPEKIDLSSLAKEFCIANKITLTELKSGSRRREVVDVRRQFCKRAVMHHGYSGAEAARFLGVTTSCVIRSLAPEKYE